MATYDGFAKRPTKKQQAFMDEMLRVGRKRPATDEPPRATFYDEVEDELPAR